MRLGTLIVPGTAIAAALTRLTVQLSNRRFVIYIPLVIVIIAAIVIIVIAGSGCAPITVIEVAAVQRTRGTICLNLIAVAVIIATQIA